MSRVRSQFGMTLIELIIVVALIGLLLAAAGPSLGIWLRNLQIRNTAESIQNGMQVARMEAMRRNERVRFSLVTNLSAGCALSASTGSWVVSLDDPAGGCATAPSATAAPRIVSTYAAGEGSTASGANVSVAALQSDLSTAASSVVFDGFGRVVGATGIARISFDNTTSGDDYRALRITVNAAGNIRMCEPKVSTSSDDPRRC